MTELEKIKRQASRVMKVFRGIYKLRDILDTVSDFKDTLERACKEKLAGMSVESIVKLIISRSKSLQEDLNGISITMEQERKIHNKSATLPLLTGLKEELLEIKQLSLSLPAMINQKAGGVLSSLRNSIDKIVLEIHNYINEVRAWK